MKPFEFVLFDGDSSPDTPILEINEAMHKELVIRSDEDEWEVLSYYYDDDATRMVIDIQKRKSNVLCKQNGSSTGNVN